MLEKLEKEIKQERKLFLEQNILRWGKYYFPEKFSSEFCGELHNYFIDIRNESFTSTLAPREHAKTTIKCFLIPVFQALVEPDSYKFYLNVQNTATKAIDVNLSIRLELENNEKLIRDYENQVATEKWTEKQFVLKNGVVFSAIGAGESMRGINYRNVRPDYIICDDLYDQEDIHNLNRINKKNNWFWGSLYPARSKTKKSCIHIQGTAINQQDLMHSLEDKQHWVFRKFQAITDYNKEETLWGVNQAFSFEKLMLDRENMGSIIFERELQNNCRDDETAIIKESWIKYYDGNIQFGEKTIKKIGGLDPAVGQKQLNDFSGFAAVQKTNLGNYYINDIKEEKITFNEIIETSKNFNKRHEFNNFRIEEIAAFQFIGQELKRTTDIPVDSVKCVTDKISRLEAQSKKFENGKVFINENIPLKLRNKLVEQLINNEPNHDDIKDAVVICLEDDKGGKVELTSFKIDRSKGKFEGY